MLHTKAEKFDEARETWYVPHQLVLFLAGSEGCSEPGSNVDTKVKEVCNVGFYAED